MNSIIPKLNIVHQHRSSKQHLSSEKQSMTDSQNRILDFRAKGTRKKGYCANPSHFIRVTDLKSSHDYKRKERQ